MACNIRLDRYTVDKFLLENGFLFSSELPKEENVLMKHFLTALAICNTSFIVHEHRESMGRLSHEPTYEGENADDLVLCRTASSFGVRMIERSAQSVAVRYFDSSATNYQDVKYEILCLLPFDTSRKSMSIIVRVDEKVFLFIKGAESSIWPHLNNSNDEDIKVKTEEHSLDFAQQGYRLLSVAYRQLRTEQFEEWYHHYQLAANQLDDREGAISEAAKSIEVDLILAGLTAVEDKLQDGVPKTIYTLRCAGIKIWLLTGDKEATALSTAQAASLVSSVHQKSSQHPSLLTDSVSCDLKLNQRTYMIYYSSQLQELDRENYSEETRTSETIARIKDTIAAQSLPVCLVITGDDLSK